ncbi:MAG: glutamine amidotransferase [Vicinamibacterales bacterium]
MLDALFEALFSYRPVVFQQGEFRLDLFSTQSLLVGLLGVGLMAATVITYRRTGGKGRTRDRVVLGAIRLALLALLVFCLFRPTLVVLDAIPQQNVIAVLIDDSSSMQIPDVDAAARGAWAREFAGPEQAVTRALAERFVVRPFRFSSVVGRLRAPEDLTFAGTQTKLGRALDGVREELAGLPVAGVVLISDGADTSEEAIGEALLGMQAQRVPVFTVGVGSPQLERDIQVDRVSTPPRVLKDASLLVDVVVSQTGYSGRTVTLDVEDGGRIIGSQEVVLPLDGSPAAVQVRARATEAGPRVFRFRVPPQEDELISQNNTREALIDVRDVKEKILYFEGEPRFEMKFLRRAVADDENLQVVVLQRTADTKYMRLEVDDPDELLGGFPKTREELFAYRGLIIGSVEAGLFSGDQLQMIADFVDRRGGGLLMVGGGRAFAEGGYGGTPVADALPLAIDPGVRASEPAVFERLKVLPTRQGQTHAVTQIAGTEAASRARWPELPQVTTVNAPFPVKPGATALLEGTDERGRTHVVLASQQYGRGKSLAFTAQDSWLWQMDASISVEDQTHENFWRQMLRWLVDGVPEVVQVRTTSEQVVPGEPVTLEATVVDKAFVDLNDASVVVTVLEPDGATVDVPLQWTGDRDGLYRGTFVSRSAGVHEARADASRQGEAIGSTVTYFRVGAPDAEYFDAAMHEAPLRRIADETGGRYYTPATVGGLPEDVRYTGRGVTSVEERPLWQMPIVFVLLLGLMIAEWAYRRAVGLA